jgi:uncharacterized protein
MTPSAILDRWYATMRNGNLDALREVATSDIRVWWNGPQDLVPWAGEHAGIEATIAFFRMVTGHLDVLRTSVTERLETESAIIVFLDAHWRVKASRVDIMAKAMNVFRFRDGRVAGYEVYPDSAAFVRALSQGAV